MSTQLSAIQTRLGVHIHEHVRKMAHVFNGVSLQLAQNKIVRLRLLEDANATGFPGACHCEN
jgi:hypothetical protein